MYTCNHTVYSLFRWISFTWSYAFNVHPRRDGASLVAQSVKSHLPCGRPGFDPWSGKIPWRRDRLPTRVFWPGEFHGLYRGRKESDTTEPLSLHMRWPKYWSFSFSIIPSTEIPGLTSFRMDWFDLLAVQGTLKSLPQHHSSKVSILQCSAFFIVQLSHPYMTTGKTIALTRRTFVGKVYTIIKFESV